MAETATAPEAAAAVGFGVALDPLRPRDLVVPPGLASVPPTCPECGTLLHPVDNNPAGDVLFECLNGNLMTAGHYSAVFRVATRTWDQHPAFRRADWIAPGARRPDGTVVSAAEVAAAPAPPRPRPRKRKRARARVRRTAAATPPPAASARDGTDG
jgi:hypothetical protein